MILYIIKNTLLIVNDVNKNLLYIKECCLKRYFLQYKAIIDKQIYMLYNYNISYKYITNIINT